MSENNHDEAQTSATLAAFIVHSTWDDLPETVRHAAKRSLLNGFGTAFAGCKDSALDISAATLLQFSGSPEATLIGRTEKADILTASFLNAAALNVHDFDDTHLRTVIHPTAPVAPALMALAERRMISGRDFLHALALGIETACRVGNAVSPGHYRRGWHITATCGVFGAAVAVGKILGLDERRMLNALGAASAQASGLVETLGFMAKSIGVGASCRGGLFAAMLAENGLDGPDRPLEGPRGFLTVTGDAPNLDDVSGALGQRWEILKNIHKPYPCGVVLNAVIDACLELQTGAGAATDNIDTVTLYGHPLLRQRADRPNVETGREAQVSAQHTVAACLLQGAAGLAQFSDAAVQNPAVRALRQKVCIVDDADQHVAGVRAVVTRTDGSTQEIIVEHARGTDERPPTDAEIEAKFKTLAAYGAPDCGRAEELIDTVWHLDKATNAGAMMALCRPTN